MGKGCTIRAEQLPGDAPTVSAKFGNASGKLNCGSVVIREPALGVGEIDGGGQLIQRLAEVLLILIVGMIRAVPFRELAGSAPESCFSPRRFESHGDAAYGRDPIWRRSLARQQRRPVWRRDQDHSG